MNIYFLGRVFGIAAFVLIFVQMCLGPFMNFWRRVLGGWVLKLHIVIGITAFVLAWLHPVMWVLVWGWNTVRELGGYVWFGKVGLILITMAAAAGVWRAHPMVTKYWRWIHRLNYVVFVLIYIHSWKLGTDAGSFPFKAIYYLAPVVLVLALTRKLLELRITANGNR